MTEPTISVSQLRKLAAEADVLGAKRYAEAYRIVAKRLEEMGEKCEVLLQSRARRTIDG